MSLSTLGHLSELRNLRLTKGNESIQGVTPLQIDLLTLKASNGALSEIRGEKGRMEILFNGGVVLTQTGSEMEVKGSFPFYLPYGEVADQEMEVRSHVKAQELLNNWMEELGVEVDSELWKRVQEGNIPFQSAVFCPGVKVEDAPHLLLFSLFAITLSKL